MNKLPPASKIGKMSPNYYHHLKKQSPGVPQDNVIDLRKTKLGKQEYDSTENINPLSLDKIITKLPVKESFWQRWKKQKAQAKLLQAKKAEELRKNKEKLEIIKKIATEKKEKVAKTERVEKKIEPAKAVAKPVEVKRPPIKKVSFGSSSSWRLSLKPLSIFVIICLVLILPLASSAVFQKVSKLKSSVLSLSTDAFDNIKIGSQLATEFNFQEATTQFNDAFSKFNEAKTEIDGFNKNFSLIMKMIPVKGEEYKSAKNLVSAASYLSGAAADLSSAFDVLGKLNLDVLQSVDQENSPKLTDVIVMAHSSLQPASEKIDLAVAALEDVNPEKLPAEYQDSVKTMKTELPKINSSLKQVLTLSETMLIILGHEQSRRYLVVFQNNRELRASGGFLGSFGLVDIDQGKVTKMVIPNGGTYDLNGNLKAQVASPEPLHLLNPVWQIQDANWWPDWPTSAQKIEWFYNQSEGPTVDGVLSLTPDVIEQMLKITGPIDMTESYGEIINADNFYDIVQKEAEKKYDETRESKKIIADLTPKLLDSLFSLKADNTLNVLQVFYQALMEKNILLYFNDPVLEGEMVNLGWSGSIKDTPGDYLDVVNTNIGGGKTDSVIEEIIKHQSTVDSDGAIIDKVTVTRTHKGNASEPFANMTNWDYVRIYVPEGSELLAAEGFQQPDKKSFLDLPEGYTIDKDLKNISGDTYLEENTQMRINKEFNKTVFANWVSVSPGDSVTYSVTYKLPFKLSISGLMHKIDTYSLLVQKQPGSFNSLLHTELILPDNVKTKWHYPEDFDGSYDTVLDTDKYLGLVLEKQ